MQTIQRKTILNKSKVEYADYAINHALGCGHGCKYPCYAFQRAKRYGWVKSYKEWTEPQLVENALELLVKEIPKKKDKIEFVHLSFMTDPFMKGYKEVSDMSLKIIGM